MSQYLTSWSLQIHKCQGLTLENAVIDFGYGTFSSGQAYTALSRTKTLEGIYLLRPIRVSDIKIDINILRFVHESERFPNLKSLKDSFGKFDNLRSAWEQCSSNFSKVFPTSIAPTLFWNNKSLRAPLSIWIFIKGLFRLCLFD